MSKEVDDSQDVQIYSPQSRRESLDSSALHSLHSSLAHAEENETEIFSGAASQVVPSSVSKFHHHIHSINSPSIVSLSPSHSRGGESFVLSEPYADQNRETEEGTGTTDKQFSRRARFSFFTTDEIESAKGVSSLRRMTTNSRAGSVPIDYDTNWNNFEDDYTDSEALASEDERSGLSPEFEAVHGSFNSDSPDYGSTNNSREADISGNTDRAGYAERRLTYDAEDDFVRKQLNDDMLRGNHEKANIKYHDQLFLPKFPARNESQRFYLAEEDLVLGIASYKVTGKGLALYYTIITLTLGLGYLFFRWFPRYRIQILAKRVPLAKAEIVIIEDEFGLLDVINVKREWYNRRISTFIYPSDIYPKEDDNENGDDPIIPVLISFEYRYMKFFYDPRVDLYRLATNWIDKRWCHYPDLKDGITKEIHMARKDIFGNNMIEIKDKSVYALLRDEILHPFYAFQIFSIILWLSDSYYYYAFCIFIISVLSISQSLIETLQNMERMRQLALFECTIRVRRNGYWTEVSSGDLVPGDVYEVSDPSLSILPCDSLLLSGDCIVNESMLTGESVPVSKIPITAETVKNLKQEYTSAKFSSHFAKSFLYSGTKIVRCRYGSNGTEPATALVMRTGFNTTKGSLVRTMLFPKPTGFKFYEDSFKYVGVMGLVAGFGFLFSIINFVKLGVDTKTIILRALDIITIIVPPALPATLTIGTSFALARLRKKNIFCIAPTRLNIGGKLDVVCFDKTGTLTQEGLDVMGLNVSKSMKDRKQHMFTNLFKNLNEMMLSERNAKQSLDLFLTMLTCHSLKVIGGELIGDPLDAKMFEFTGWQLTEDPSENAQLHQYISEHKLPQNANPILFTASDGMDSDQCFVQIKEYEFISQLRRMSVICQSNDNNDDEIKVFVKGAPEVMQEICLAESIPENFQDLLSHYTHSGYRVIACATKVIPHPPRFRKNLRDLTFLNDFSREKVESELEFIGLIVFENKLKGSTKQVLSELSNAGVRTVMCTGDNVLTAVSVAKECSLIDSSTKVYIASFDYENLADGDFQAQNKPPITWNEVDEPELRLDSTTLVPTNINQDDNYCVAVTGDVFKYILTEMADQQYLIERMIMRGAIFARMSPDEKHELVDRLRSLDYTVSFCGDGANDCGALKAADVGISLSEAEASVAAPFTSKTFEITCVPDVIKEGRAALVTSFSCFQYMSLYSAIQFISVSILYKEGVNLGDFQFLYIDLFIIIPIAIFMSWSKAYPIMCKKRPTANLISPKILVPLLGSIIIECFFQIFGWQLGKNPEEPWYRKAIPGNDEEVKCSDNTVVFLFANFQYIFVALMLTVGPPYRESAIKNKPFIITVITTICFSIVLMGIDPSSWFGDLMDLTWTPQSLDIKLLISAFLNYVTLEFGHKHLFMKAARIYKRMFGRKKSNKKFKNLKKEFSSLGAEV